VYRDGVSSGQRKTVMEAEAKPFVEQLNELVAKGMLKV